MTNTMEVRTKNGVEIREIDYIERRPNQRMSVRIPVLHEGEVLMESIGNMPTIVDGPLPYLDPERHND